MSVGASDGARDGDIDGGSVLSKGSGLRTSIYTGTMIAVARRIRNMMAKIVYSRNLERAFLAVSTLVGKMSTCNASISDISESSSESTTYALMVDISAVPVMHMDMPSAWFSELVG